MIYHDPCEIHCIGAIPCAHDFRQDGVSVDRHSAGLSNAGDRDVSRHFRPVARSIDDTKHFVPSHESTQGRKSHTNAGQGTRYDQCLASRFLDGFDPCRIIPGVNLAGTGDIDRIRIVMVDLGDERAVRSVGDRRRGEGWYLGKIRPSYSEFLSCFDSKLSSRSQKNCALGLESNLVRSTHSNVARRHPEYRKLHALQLSSRGGRSLPGICRSVRYRPTGYE